MMHLNQDTEPQAAKAVFPVPLPESAQRA